MKIGHTPERSPRIVFTVLLSVLLAGVSAHSMAAGITTFAADCQTPKTAFVLGDVVCARAVGLTGFQLAFLDADGFIVQKTDILTDPQTEKFTLPTTDTSSIGGFFIANNLGSWRVTAVTSRNSVKTGNFFTVRDPDNVKTDLSIGMTTVGGTTPAAGDTVQFAIRINNFGPDDAANVQFSDDVFSNASFDSLQQTGGPQFTCNHSDCTIASFPNGAVATFVLTFTAGAAGGNLENTATVSSDTSDLNPDDNSASSASMRVGTNGTPPACTLECANNMVVSANTTNQGVTGAFVTLPGAEAFGTCGPVTLSPASGSFFAVGTTTVNASASGGGFCSFTVTVIETAPPTISCPPNITVNALSGQPTAFVPDPNGVASDPGFATGTGSNISIVGERSDDLPLSDAYPVGITNINWTATDDGGRSVSCVQRITVISPDAPHITCPPDKTFHAPTGTCSVTVSAADIGTPTTSGLNVTVSSTRSDFQALTDPFPAGDTFITWTATNSFGNASCIQHIHVTAVDVNPPTLTIPADVTAYTSSCSAVLDDELGVATATDDCTGSVNIIRTGVPPHFEFPTGTTNVTYTAVDAAGNSVTKVQHVTVLENPAIKPTITPPADVTVSTGPNATTCGAVVNNATLGNATATDNCAGVSITRSGVPAGNLFPVGDTFVTYTATDASGNTASASQKVTVVDTTSPTISCPPSMTLEPTCPSGAIASWPNPIAADNCSVTTTQTAGPAKGSVFAIGTTTVTYTAQDPAGNQASCSFTVTVLTVPAAITNLRNLVAAGSLNAPQQQGLLPKLDSALSALEKGNTQNACQSLGVFSNQLQNFIDHGDITAAQGQAWLASAAHLINALGCTNNPCQ